MSLQRIRVRVKVTLLSSNLPCLNKWHRHPLNELDKTDKSSLILPSLQLSLHPFHQQALSALSFRHTEMDTLTPATTSSTWARIKPMQWLFGLTFQFLLMPIHESFLQSHFYIGSFSNGFPSPAEWPFMMSSPTSYPSPRGCCRSALTTFCVLFSLIDLCSGCPYSSSPCSDSPDHFLFLFLPALWRYS